MQKKSVKPFAKNSHRQKSPAGRRFDPPTYGIDYVDRQNGSVEAPVERSFESSPDPTIVAISNSENSERHASNSRPGNSGTPDTLGQFAPVQLEEDPEEEAPVQGKFVPAQGQGDPEEDELLQGKFAPAQLKEDSEEEELLQGKFESVQREVDLEEEKLLQGKFPGTGAPMQLETDVDGSKNSTGMPDQLKSGLEQLGGFDLSGVTVHYNSSKPAQLNALAYTQGKDIHVGPGQEKHLPHEGWHVVQQMQGRVMPTMQANGVSINDDDSLEREADVMGVEASQEIHMSQNGSSTIIPETSAMRIAPHVFENCSTRKSPKPPSSIHAYGIQRFEGDEHEQLGNRGSGTASTDLSIGNGQVLTFGEMTALAGDWFENLSQMRTLSNSQSGRAELRWARWRALGGSGTEPTVSDAIKTACMNRYYSLAARNTSHFSIGGTALNSYREHHIRALRKAFQSGASSSPNMADAMTIEAFGSHFLTDMFSSGHVRTPRLAQRTWYQSRFPNSINLIVNHMAGVMHRFLVTAHPWLNRIGQIPSAANLATQIHALGGPALASMSLGDLVSKAYHDRDNHGVDVISDRNQHGRAIPGGFAWTAVGDGQLNTGAGYHTRAMANRAVEASLADLSTLRQAGSAGAGSSFADALARIQVDGKFEAEHYIPRENTAGSNVTMSWEWGSFNAEMRTALDSVVRGSIAAELAVKSAELRRRGGQSNTFAADALDEVIRLLRLNGTGELETAMGTPAGPSSATP